MKNLILFLLLVSPIFTFSQNNAEQIINEVRKHYDSDYSFQADFTIEIDIPESETTVLTGELSLKGNKFKFSSPQQVFISDNVNVWYWTKTNKINEVQISYVEDAEDIIRPSDVFGVYLDGFDYRLTNQTVFEGRNLALIELTPTVKDDYNPYFKIKVVVDNAKYSIDQLQVFYKDGTVYTFKIKNEVQTNLVDSFFQFDEKANPDTEVIDLR